MSVSLCKQGAICKFLERMPKVHTLHGISTNGARCSRQRKVVRKKVFPGLGRSLKEKANSGNTKFSQEIDIPFDLVFAIQETFIGLVSYKGFFIDTGIHAHARKSPPDCRNKDRIAVGMPGSKITSEDIREAINKLSKMRGEHGRSYQYAYTVLTNDQSTLKIFWDS
jgi:hypothetical protein